jgi:hypothetical protein
MVRVALSVLVSVAVATHTARGDEQTRRVQEELRKRNLYFGDVDGRATRDLAVALRHYQQRKGFDVTGVVDRQTATSLNVPLTPANIEPQTSWPDVPVLRSDSARTLTEEQRARLEATADETSEPSPSVAAPAESPPAGQNLTPDQVQSFVENFLRDAETDDVEAQVRYFSFPVMYFDHGQVGQDFVEKDTRNYVKRWPQRKYMLVGPVTFAAAAQEDETLIEFPIAFSVSNEHYGPRPVTGTTDNFWTVKTEGDQLKIVAIRERREARPPNKKP